MTSITSVTVYNRNNNNQLILKDIAVGTWYVPAADPGNVYIKTKGNDNSKDSQLQVFYVNSSVNTIDMLNSVVIPIDKVDIKFTLKGEGRD